MPDATSERRSDAATSRLEALRAPSRRALRDPGPDGSRVPPHGAGHDPLANLAFWGRDRGALARSPIALLLERLRTDPRAGGAVLLVVALAVGLAWYRIGAGGSAGASGTSARSAPSRARSSTTTAPVQPSLVIHVAGAVVRPGVVRLAAGARVIDAVEAAGGARPGAELDRLNLAAKVVDGQRIAVGLPGAPIAAPTASDLQTPGGAGADTGTPVDLNTATAAELDALPGVGPTLAAAILRERDRRGGFRSVDELRGVRGIGEKRLADLRPLVTV